MSLFLFLCHNFMDLVSCLFRIESIVKLCTPIVVQHRDLGLSTKLELIGIWIMLANRTFKGEHDVGALWH